MTKSRLALGGVASGSAVCSLRALPVSLTETRDSIKPDVVLGFNVQRSAGEGGEKIFLYVNN